VSRVRITFDTPILTYQFFAIVWTRTGWAVCLAGRQGLGTHYCTPAPERFTTKRAAMTWRREVLADSPASYWTAPAGKYLLDEHGKRRACYATEKSEIRETI